MHTHFPLVQKA